MLCEIRFVAGAVADLKALDPALQELAWKQTKKVAEAPELGKPLGKKMGSSSFRVGN